MIRQLLLSPTISRFLGATVHVVLAVSLLSGENLSAQTPTVSQALQLRPMQADVDFDQPSPKDAKECQIAPEESPEETAWVVRSVSGETLRRFVDSNEDNKVDQWRYFKSGVEVYRDIDLDFNGKADQYRWLGTAGTRWGIDNDEDGEIDGWKEISAEEVSEQVINAVKGRDRRLFRSILLSKTELSSMGLGARLQKLIETRLASAEKNFAKAISKQTVVKSGSQWIDFGGLRPGTIPAGTDGSSKDVSVYENVVAMVETGGKSTQVPIGTIVKVDDGWRVIDSPLSTDDSASQFVFFEAASSPHMADAGGVSEETQALIKRLEKIDTRLAKATAPNDINRLNTLRADTLEELANNATRQSDRDMWLTQFVDTVSTSAQSGTYPEGTKRLAVLRTKLEKKSNKTSSSKALLSHVTFGYMSARYAEDLQGADSDFAEVQEAWLEQLEGFVDEYPECEDAPEAMLQLALAKEFAGEEDDANRWYSKIVRDFKDSPLSRKAAGAKRRLESVGKPLKLAGNTVTGESFDIKRLRGKVVLVHYWATWCEPCKADMEIMKDLSKELRGDGFEVVGINVDAQPKELATFYRAERPVGTHLYEKGGLDSGLAADMGVFTLPVMLLVDQRGRVVDRQIHGAQLEKEIKKLLK